MKTALILIALFAAGCGQGEKPQQAETKAPPVEYFHVDPATAGTITGKIVYHGEVPKPKLISMDADAACQKANGNKPVYDQPVMVSKDGGLADVFVYIKSGLEGKKFEPPKQEVEFDQRGCMFVPHILGIQAAEAIDIKNSDKVAHNVHTMPKNNREFNDEQAPGAPDAVHKFARTEVMVPVKCNVHQWMHAYIGVVENPYFAVTGRDGSFELKNVPPGDYTVAIWHEKLGEQTKQVHVAASDHAAIDFNYQ